MGSGEYPDIGANCFDELVSYYLSSFRDSAANSHNVSAADRMARSWLFWFGPFSGGGVLGDPDPASVCLRRFARIWARFRSEGVRNKDAGYHITANRRRGPIRTNA